MNDLYFITCHICAFITLFSAFALYIQSDKKNRESKTLAGCYFIFGGVIFMRLLAHYTQIAPSEGTTNNLLFIALYVSTIHSGFLYKRLYPQKLEGWSIVKLFIPIVSLLLLLYVLTQMGVTFPSFNPILAIRKGEFFRPDILYRCIVYWVCLGIMIHPVVKILKTNHNRFLRAYSTILLFYPIILSAMFFHPQGIFAYAVAYQLVSCFIVAGVTGFLLAEEQRQKSPSTQPTENNLKPSLTTSTIQSTEEETTQPDNATPQIEIATTCHSTLASYQKELDTYADIAKKNMNAHQATLWEKTKELMQNEEPWRDPNIRLERIALLVGSNRTSLATVIHMHGFKTFHDFIAHYRIEAFCLFARENHVLSVTQLFENVGFQSTSSAFKHFKRIHGITPSQFIDLLN